MLFYASNFHSLKDLDNDEKIILKKYDIFQFYEIFVRKSQVKEFNNLLNKYLILLKLKNYSINYIESINWYNIKFNRIYNFDKLYLDNVLSLNDIINIKKITLNNFSDNINIVDFEYFYFKNYNDAKNFLKDINKVDTICNYIRHDVF